MIKGGKLSHAFGWCCLIFSASIILYLTFSNLDMTPQRLFVTYWYFYLPLILIILIGAKEIMS